VSSGLLTSVFMAAMKDSTDASTAAASTSIASDRRAAFNTAARLYNYTPTEISVRASHMFEPPRGSSAWFPPEMTPGVSPLFS